MLGLFCIGTQFKVLELKSISGKPLILALTAMDNGYSLSIFTGYLFKLSLIFIIEF